MAPEEPESHMQEIEVDDEVYEFLVERSAQSGRTLSDQLAYELQVNRGLIPPDPNDEEGKFRAQFMPRVLGRQPPLRG